MRGPLARLALVLAVGLTPACNCGGDDDGVDPDATTGVNTAHCAYEPVAATGGAGSAVTPGTLEAGAAEVVPDIPVGTGLGGYTGRANFLGSFEPVDERKVAISAAWQATVGIETRPMVKAVALRAGGETVVWLKLDAIFAYEDWVFELENRLGPAFRGKVLISTSHSHSAWSQFTGHSPLKVGSGEFRAIVHERFTDAMEAAARAALGTMEPARIGFHSSMDFDPTDVISRERRGENDDLPGGNRKDEHLRLLRIDAADGRPIAVIPIFGMHPTLNDADNPLASTDAVGGLERAVEERFDRKVVVMHVQSAGADVSAAGHGRLDCDVHPGAEGDPCFTWLAAEGHGRAAEDILMNAWTDAGAAMTDQLAISMVTQSVELGPYSDTYQLRGGALTYAPFDLTRPADQVVWNGDAIVSPIDEYNAPVGAALCENAAAMFPAAAMPGVEGVDVYGSCLRLDVAGAILGDILDLSIGDINEHQPACGTTRTTISALRLGDYLIGTIPGELSVLLADKVRASSPVDVMHTIAVGYSQGHIGYCLTPEDWLQGGYEPSVTFGGPLEAEFVAEKLAALMPQALAPVRPDAAAAGADRVLIPIPDDSLPQDDPAPMAGTVPAAISADVWMRSGRPVTAQPLAQVPRVSGLARFVWQGDDPLTRTPLVLLMREDAPGSGTYAPVLRRSGREVADGDLLVSYSPSPLRRAAGAQTHIWAVEWQAIPWRGSGAIDTLAARGAVPLGRYRFHVQGDGWILESNPFEVVAGTLDVSATRSGNVISAFANWNAPQGWRLLDLAGPSNVPVPLRSQPVTVTGFAGAVQVGVPQNLTTDNAGRANADFGAAAGTVTRVEVRDASGNSGSASL